MVRIALDGPSGAGKSTLAKAIPKRLGITYLDTGALYRTVGLAVRDHAVDPADQDAVAELLKSISVNVELENGCQVVYLDGKPVGDAIRTPEMSMYASKVSAIPAVRVFLLETQRGFARKNSVIMDGRDIGTCVLPHAQKKIYLTASSEVRAKRRCEELRAKGEACDLKKIQADIEERDYRDMHRETSPLKQAEDAVLVDTSDMTIEEVVEKLTVLCAKE